ncbi:hypothetical protein PHMEG_00019760 [Phytophthora megakarya]|uniref:Uncharacterized protein n=1 Tax=Phytophthora megakarya TaxID=4795 RepID=A0A225VSC6_9STRA|nr:hypothetical protein PHMEG_00019760 [Phytophthora megakarya]
MFWPRWYNTQHFQKFAAFEAQHIRADITLGLELNCTTINSSKNRRWKHRDSYSTDWHPSPCGNTIACLEDAGVTGLIDTLTVSRTTKVYVDACENQSTPCHYWGGKFRRVQSDFAFLYCSTVTQRLSQLHYVMSKIEKATASENILNDNQSVDEATQVFTACAGSVDVD